ncbi:uncharacterized protein LOC143232022 isoform X2 [Tachypleus tridentatus]|uniref:uncharacterized protein LOC143232022 isoform X2 n=1 Tax=Tachypleus tridentatus TaxID=6853 RepID=UPI003FD5BA6A
MKEGLIQYLKRPETWTKCGLSSLRDRTRCSRLTTSSYTSLAELTGRTLDGVGRAPLPEAQRLVSMATKLLVKSQETQNLPHLDERMWRGNPTTKTPGTSTQPISECFQAECSSAEKRSTMRIWSSGHHRRCSETSVQQIRSPSHRPVSSLLKGNSRRRLPRVKNVLPQPSPPRLLQNSKRYLKTISKNLAKPRPLRSSCVQTDIEISEFTSGNTPNPEMLLREPSPTVSSKCALDSSGSASNKPKLHSATESVGNTKYLLTDALACAQASIETSLTTEESDRSSSDDQERESSEEEPTNITDSSSKSESYKGETPPKKELKSSSLGKIETSRSENENICKTIQKHGQSDETKTGDCTMTLVVDVISEQNVSSHVEESVSYGTGIMNGNDIQETQSISNNNDQGESLNSCFKIEESVSQEFTTSDIICKQDCIPKDTIPSQTSDDFSHIASSEASEIYTTESSDLDSFTGDEYSYTDITSTDLDGNLSEVISSRCGSCCSCSQVTDEEDNEDEEGDKSECQECHHYSEERLMTNTYGEFQENKENDDADVTFSQEPEAEVKVEPKVTKNRLAIKSTPVFLAPPVTVECDIMHTGKPIPDDLVNASSETGSLYRQLSEEEFVSTLKIHEAAKSGDLHVIKLLLKNDRKRIETVDERGWTPIHLAAANGHVDIIKFLAQEGAHLAALDPSGYTAIHLAAMNGHASCIEILLNQGCEIENVTSEGFTPLHLTVINDHVDCCKLLLSMGANITRRDALNRTVHDIADEYSLDEMRELLDNYCRRLQKIQNIL